MYKVESNEELFNRIKEISAAAELTAKKLKGFGAIVQNGIEISDEELIEFKANLEKSLSEFKKSSEETSKNIKAWWSDIITHIKNCNP